MIKKVLVLSLALTWQPALAKKGHHHVNIDTTPQTGLTVEDDIYQQGSYYYPTLTQTFGEFSVGLSGQNLASFDTQNSLYGMAGWNPKITDDLTVLVGSMIGSTFTQPQWDFYYYAMGNYEFCDYFTLAVGPYMENGVIGLTTSATVTIDDFQLTPFYVSGNGNMAGSGVNLLYQVTKNLQPYMGYGYSGGQSYLALGFNLSMGD